MKRSRTVSPRAHLDADPNSASQNEDIVRPILGRLEVALVPEEVPHHVRGEERLHYLTIHEGPRRRRTKKDITMLKDRVEDMLCMGKADGG